MTVVRDDEAGALGAHAAVEEGVDRDDAARAARVDARRIEPVADERRGTRSRLPRSSCRTVVARRPSARRPRPRSSPQRRRRRSASGRAEHRSDERDDREGSARIVHCSHADSGRFHVKTGPALGCCRRGRRRAQRDADDRPPGLGFQRDVAVHRGRQLAGDREAEPAARGDIRPHRGRSARTRASAARPDARPVVLDLEVGVLAVGPRTHATCVPAACARARCRRARGRSGARAARRPRATGSPSTSTSS